MSCRLNGQCCLIKAWFLIQTFIFYCLYCLLQIIYMWLLTANTVIKTFILWPIISGICSVKQRSISKEFLKKIYCQPPKTQISYFLSHAIQHNFRISAKLSIHGKFSDFFLRLFKNVRVIFWTKCVIPRFIRYHKVAWGNEHYILTGQMKKSEGNTGGSSLTKLW